MRDGTLFVPIRLLDGERPYRRLTGVAARQLLEPRDAVRARVGDLPAARHARRRACSGTCSRTARASSASSAPARTRSTARPRTTKSGHRPGLRAQHRALPRGQRPARPARAQPLRPARRGHDARDVRLRRGGDRRAGPRRVLPRDVPAAELGEQLGVPRDAAADARARGARAERRPRAGSSSRSRRRARGCSRASRSPSHDAPTSFGRLSYTRRGEGRRRRRVGRRSGVRLAADAEAARCAFRAASA